MSSGRLRDRGLGPDRPGRRGPHRHPGPARPAQRPDAGHLDGARRRRRAPWTDDVRVVVVRGEGRSFSAGLDRSLFSADPGTAAASATLGRLPAERGAGAHPRLPGRLPVAALARASSRSPPCRGTPSAPARSSRSPATCGSSPTTPQLRLPEATLGLVPDLTGTSTLVELVGYSRALEICLTGRAVRAAEARAIGLANARRAARPSSTPPSPTWSRRSPPRRWPPAGRPPRWCAPPSATTPRRRTPPSGPPRCAGCRNLSEVADTLLRNSPTRRGVADAVPIDAESAGLRGGGVDVSHPMTSMAAMRSFRRDPSVTSAGSCPKGTVRRILGIARPVPARADLLPAAGRRLLADRRRSRPLLAGDIVNRIAEPRRHGRRHRPDRPVHRRAGGARRRHLAGARAGTPRGSARASSTTCAAGCSSTCSGCRSPSSPAPRPARWSAG